MGLLNEDRLALFFDAEREREAARREYAHDYCIYRRCLTEFSRSLGVERSRWSIARWQKPVISYSKLFMSFYFFFFSFEKSALQNRDLLSRESVYKCDVISREACVLSTIDARVLHISYGVGCIIRRACIIQESIISCCTRELSCFLMYILKCFWKLHLNYSSASCY